MDTASSGELGSTGRAKSVRAQRDGQRRVRAVAPHVAPSQYAERDSVLWGWRYRLLELTPGEVLQASMCAVQQAVIKPQANMGARVCMCMLGASGRDVYRLREASGVISKHYRQTFENHKVSRRARHAKVR
jgi:hypothetical protein